MQDAVEVVAGAAVVDPAGAEKFAKDAGQHW